MTHTDYVQSLAAIIRWDGADIDDLAETIAAARDLGDIAGAVLRMQARQPASTIWGWPEDEDIVAQDASGSVLRWSDLDVGYGYAA
jgi:hypothetical protein